MSGVFCLDALSSASCIGLEKQTFLELSLIGLVKALLPLSLLCFAYTRWRAGPVTLLVAGLFAVLTEVLACIPRLAESFMQAQTARHLSVYVRGRVLLRQLTCIQSGR
jgi:hypothetical protein